MPNAANSTNSLQESATIVSIRGLGKVYASGHVALKQIDLDIRRGEILALLGPNGAGKTTLISIICGIVRPSSGVVLANGHDVVKEYRAAREQIGLVPQELSTDAFESVWSTVTFSRGLFGKAPDPAHIEKVLRDLSLWDKKDSKIAALSGGMKRRVLIASTSPPQAWTWSCVATCGRWSARCAKAASPSSSPRTTSKKPKRWPTASA
jgi:ABC-2 type transport system ATP-binding protein